MRSKEVKKLILAALLIFKKKAIDIKDDGTGLAIDTIDTESIANFVLKEYKR